MEAVLKPILDALGVVLAGALVALITKLLQKYNLQISADKAGQLEYYAHQGIAYAEELGLNYFKKYGEKMDSVLKGSQALEYVVAKLPRVDPDEAAKVIKALLPDKRAAMTQATTAVVELGKALATPEVQTAPLQPSPVSK